uniref:Variant surface glycoprotein 1857 n=1 Tax=Trypanosoma brucei TaxID=5691 RepID=M4SXI5_9TRYP|nr:variant surface glycoprotein 1857 [Trypanosoma brucei]
MATLATAVQLAEPSAKAFDEAVVQKICRVATELDKISSVALQKQEALIKEIKAAYEAELIAFLAAEAEDDANASTLYKAAAAAAGTCGAAAAAELEELQKVALLATVNAGKATGAINEFVDFLIAVSTGGTTGTCLAAVGGNPSGTNANTRLGCTPTSTADITPTAGTNTEVLDKTGYKELSSNGDGSNAQASTKYRLLKAVSAGSATSELWQRPSPPETPVMFGFLTVTAHNNHATTAINTLKLDTLGTDWETKIHKQHQKNCSMPSDI